MIFNDFIYVLKVFVASLC